MLEGETPMKNTARTVLLTILMLLLALSGAAAAASDGAWWDGMPMTAFRYEGLRNVGASTVDRLLSPYLGEPFSDATFSEINSVLYAQEWVSYVYAEALQEGNDGHLTILFTFAENPMVTSVTISGNDRIGEAVAGDCLDFFPIQIEILLPRFFIPRERQMMPFFRFPILRQIGSASVVPGEFSVFCSASHEKESPVDMIQSEVSGTEKDNRLFELFEIRVRFEPERNGSRLRFDHGTGIIEHSPGHSSVDDAGSVFHSTSFFQLHAAG